MLSSSGVNMIGNKLIHEVSQEEFNKLSQLDRIEYRQKDDNLNNSKVILVNIIIDLLLMTLVGFVLIVSFRLAVFMYLGSNNIIVDFLGEVLAIYLCSMIFIIAATFLLIAYVTKDINKFKRELDNQYFYLEFKVKGGKNNGRSNN